MPQYNGKYYSKRFQQKKTTIGASDDESEALARAAGRVSQQMSICKESVNQQMKKFYDGCKKGIIDPDKD